RHSLPRPDRPNLGQQGLVAAMALRLVLQGRDVRQRLVEGPGTVLARQYVVNLDARQAGILPSRAVVDEEADILRRAPNAKVAAVPGGLLDFDGGLEQALVRVVADAGDLLVGRVQDHLLDDLEGAIGQVPEVVGVRRDEPLKLNPFLAQTLSAREPRASPSS